MLLVAKHVVKQKEALVLTLGETLKNVNGLINLCEKIGGIEVPIAIFAGLQNDPGFPDGYESVR